MMADKLRLLEQDSRPVIEPEALAGVGWALERAALDLAGYSAPLPLAEPSRMESARAAHVTGMHYTKNPHTTSAGVRALLNDPGLVAQVHALCGPRLRLWRSAFFTKDPGAGELGWHHDKHFYCGDGDDIRLDEISSHFSILFALTEISQATGMVEVIPGSHRENSAIARDRRPQHKRPSSEHILSGLPPQVQAAARAVPIPAGSFLVFHSALLHRSRENRDGPPRLGVAIRLIREGLDIPVAMARPEDVMAFPPPA